MHPPMQSPVSVSCNADAGKVGSLGGSLLCSGVGAKDFNILLRLRDYCIKPSRKKKC